MIKTKYSINDTVYCGRIVSSTEKIECPDCHGTRYWDWTSPGGLSGKVKCPRCHGSGHIGLQSFEPYIRQYTIGSVRYDSAEQKRSPISYMCKETGIGSGSVYREDELFDTEEEARNHAQTQANVANEKLDNDNPCRAELRFLSQYDIVDMTEIEACKKWQETEQRLGYLLNRICELSTCPVAGKRYNSSTSLKENQIEAIQESLVWLDDYCSDYLDNYRNAE